MNAQREIIYEQRREVLDGENLKDNILNMIKSLSEEVVLTYFAGEEEANVEALDMDIQNTFGIEMSDFIKEHAKDSKAIIEKLQQAALDKYTAKEEDIGSEDLRELERVVMLKVVDQKWMDHIDDMEQLRQGIGLQAYGQRDPKVEYKMSAFEMFDEMIAGIQQDTVRLLYHVRIEQKVEREQVAEVTGTNKDEEAKGPVRRAQQKVYPNDPCPCGSGKKYKQCCGRKNKA